MSTAERKQALLDIASGKAGIVVGTHAVLGEQVSFADLGLVVIDEQHRFGVEQRNALRHRYNPTPHMLVMSATPIPRSVAMTVFGDLELTVLKGLPGGRSPIQTHLVPMMKGPRYIGRVWERVREEVDKGHQVYVVCPKISAVDKSPEDLQAQLDERFGEMLAGESGAAFSSGTGSSSGAASSSRSRSEGGRPVQFTREEAEAFIANDASVELMETKLNEQPLLAELRKGVVHGRMPAEEKEATMTAFERGEVDILISTTVIEVGVDVPNATLMVILDADAFGVSTLHQLRGRIGRGRTETNQCLLVTRLPEGHHSLERLSQVAEHSDGMELARLDLVRRREGDVLGASQAGRSSSLKLLRIIRDEKIITDAARAVQSFTEADPTWDHHPELRHHIDRWIAEHDDAEEYIHRG